MKFKNILISALFFCSLNLSETKSDDLSEDFKSQQDCSWVNAAYKTVTDKGEITRYCIDNQSNIYMLIGARQPNWTGVTISGLGPQLIGNLKRPKKTQGNSCVLGTNIQCLSNIVITTSQYKVEGNYLRKYWRQDMNGSKGKVNSATLGIHREGKDELLKEAIKFNKLADEEARNGNYDEVFMLGYRGMRWYPNLYGGLHLTYAKNQQGNHDEALGFINETIKNIDSVEMGWSKPVNKGEFYFMRFHTKYKLGMDKNNYCKDLKIALKYGVSRSGKIINNLCT